MNLKEKLFKRRRIYNGKVINFSADMVLLPNGKKGFREYTEHPGAVAVLPFVDKKHIILVQQYRYPVGKITYELPAGKLDKKESPAACVRRELAEETGYYAKTVKRLFSFWPTPAFSDEVIHIYSAKNLVETKHSPDEDEFIKSEVIPLTSVKKFIEKGRIRDAKTVIAVLFWLKNNKI
ncbi:MAG: NUDIX hydrolase [Endomicrobiales bacterium]|nr:NUDIX hydrolase [Endomicrobiales bacterium]